MDAEPVPGRAVIRVSDGKKAIGALVADIPDVERGTSQRHRRSRAVASGVDRQGDAAAAAQRDAGRIDRAPSFGCRAEVLRGIRGSLQRAVGIYYCQRGAAGLPLLDIAGMTADPVDDQARGSARGCVDDARLRTGCRRPSQRETVAGIDEIRRIGERRARLNRNAARRAAERDRDGRRD